MPADASPQVSWNGSRRHGPYTAVVEVRELEKPLRVGTKVLACGSMLVLGAVLAAMVSHLRQPLLPAKQASQREVVSLNADFRIDSASHEECTKFLRFNGCNKPAYWSCDKQKDDGTPGHQCCCNDGIWPELAQGAQPSWADVASSAKTEETELRLKGGAGMCMSLSADLEEFELASCSDGLEESVFKLPPRGAGSIQSAFHKNMCLGVSEGSSRVKVETCRPGAAGQQFQLTNGQFGMVQWSMGGNRCLDVEGGEIEKGGKIVIVPCIYWPLKPSQQFMMHKPPAHATKGNVTENFTKPNATKPAHASPSLFCTSIMMWWSYEAGLLRAQLNKKVGIFACDDWAVYSNKSIQIRGGENPVYNDVMKGELSCKFGGVAHTALNTPIFKRFWDQILQDERSWRNDWIVKVDPDAVFFPSRLREMLLNRWQKTKGKADIAQWLNNCQLGLHGPIEVFSQEALAEYRDNKEECDTLDEPFPQEDAWLGACFQKIGVAKMDALNLLLEWAWACNERPASFDDKPPCFDHQVAFHPFKTIETYFKCHKRAASRRFYSPLIALSEWPSSRNHHHDSLGR